MDIYLHPPLGPLNFNRGGNILVFWTIQNIKLQHFQIDFSRRYRHMKVICTLDKIWFISVGCAPDNLEGVLKDVAVIPRQYLKDFTMCTDIEPYWKDSKGRCYKQIKLPKIPYLSLIDIKVILISTVQVILTGSPLKLHSCDQATQTLDGHTEFERYSNGLNCEAQKNNRMQLLEENITLKQQLQEKVEKIKEMKRERFEMKCEFAIEKRKISEKNMSLENKILKLEDRLVKLEKDREDILHEFGRLSVESDSIMNLRKNSEVFQKIFPRNLSPSLVVNIEGNNSSPFIPMSTAKSDVQPNTVQSESEKKPLPALSPSAEQSIGSGGEVACQSNLQSNGREAQNQRQGSQVRPNNVSIATNESNVSPESTRPFPTEVHEKSNAEPLGLVNEVCSSVSAHVYNAYKLLLLTISDMLLYNDIIKLKQWANEKFSVDTNLSTGEVILQLDQKRAINALDLNDLRAFFESITRIDLVYLIDEFCKGDYDTLKKLINQQKSRSNSHERVTNLNRVDTCRLLLPHSNVPRSPLRPNTLNRDVSNVQVLQRPNTPDENNGVYIARNRQLTETFRPNVASTSNSIVSGNRSSTHENSEDVSDRPAVGNTRGNQGNEKRISASDAPVTTRKNNEKISKQPSSPRLPESREQSSQRRPESREHSSQRRPESRHNHHNAHNPPAQYNGPSQSHPDDHFDGSRNGSRQDNWLCNHYKRRCLVKFECCDEYWPCHRCHNNESTCGRRKLKSRDTTMVKCVECGKEQQFGENGQFCVSCNTQFANFYCGLCKHLTGNDDHPYHCDKCGICRIHGDRSFHCDVCGICLDVQLRGNHKCRPGSAHDECGICLEDAFTGCQILPCSHKVHKECANRMIRSGITRCPICRESFAHKLEKRPTGRRKR